MCPVLSSVLDLNTTKALDFSAELWHGVPYLVLFPDPFSIFPKGV